MKKTAYYYLSLAAIVAGGLISCQDYEPVSYSEIMNSKFQQYKFDCVGPEMAARTNHYGMGPVEVVDSPQTRTTDAHGPAPQSLITAALNSYNSKYPTETVSLTGIVYVTTLRLGPNNNQFYYLNALGTSSVGRQVWCNTDSETVELIRTHDNNHVPAKYVTNGEYTYIVTPDDDQSPASGFVYLVSKLDMADYLLCLEDVGNNCLDYNDCVIIGGNNRMPEVIFRSADYRLEFTWQNGQQSVILEPHQGEMSQTLNINNLTTPNRWITEGVTITAITTSGQRINIPLISSAADQPAVIATRTDYKFHREEDSMTSAEFDKIPYYTGN